MPDSIRQKEEAKDEDESKIKFSISFLKCQSLSQLNDERMNERMNE